MRRNVIGLFVVAGALVATRARADCAEGSFYTIVNASSSNTVFVELQNSDRVCGDGGQMLREDTATGELVALTNDCQEDVNGIVAYEDECVPPGTYRYGLSVPYDCTMSGCGGVQFFDQVTVTAPLSTSCARASDDPAPTPAQSPPWGTGAEINQFKDCPSHGGCFCDTASTAVVSMNSFALATGLGILAFAARARRRKRA